VSFPRQYLKACSRSALPAEQSANSCQRPRPRFLGSLHRMVAVTLWSRKRRYWYRWYHRRKRFTRDKKTN